MPTKQRIAFVTNTSWSIYKFRLYLLQELIKKGYEIYVLAPRDNYTELFEHLEGINFIELKKLQGKSISLYDDFQLYKELRKHYKKIQPHLIFHYTIKACIYGPIAAAHTGCKAISVITGLGYTFASNKILKIAASNLYRHALKKANEVWFLNPDDQKIFIDSGIVKKETTFLLPGEGVDATVFYATPFQPLKKPVVFLLIGRLIKHKGIYEFATASGIMQKKKVDAKFQLLGFTDDKSAVAISKEQLAKWEKAGNIDYLGTTDNVAPFIAKADCIVLPSYREGMPLSLLEGSSMCKAIIASDVAGCREIVKDGINGFLCKAKNAEDLAVKMEKYCSLTDAEKHAMGMAGREIVMSHFTKEIITGIYINKLQSLLA
ncbi:MAG: glycosyltransferase family 4 protein [Chitinophagaceae bacterium]